MIKSSERSGQRFVFSKSKTYVEYLNPHTLSSEEVEGGLALKKYLIPSESKEVEDDAFKPETHLDINDVKIPGPQK